MASFTRFGSSAFQTEMARRAAQQCGGFTVSGGLKAGHDIGGTVASFGPSFPIASQPTGSPCRLFHKCVAVLSPFLSTGADWIYCCLVQTNKHQLFDSPQQLMFRLALFAALGFVASNRSVS